MKASRLSEKSMSDKRFRKTENTIFLTYCRIKDYCSAKKLAKLAGISRSTLYRHHPCPQKVLQDYEDYLLSVYKHRIKESLQKPETPIRNIFFQTLIFIVNHKRVFLVLIKGNSRIIERMLNTLKPVISKEFSFITSSNKIYRIYENEVLGVIETWASQNFSDKKIHLVLNDIMFLTESARQRLSPLSR